VTRGVLLLFAACGAQPTPATVTVAPPVVTSATPEEPPVGTLQTFAERADVPAAPEVLAAGKVTVVHFFASWCFPCKKSLPDLDALYKLHGGRVAVVAIGEDDDEADMRSFVTSAGVVYTVLWDSAKAKATRWHPSAMPTTYVVDKRGGIRFTHVGYRDEDAKTLEGEVAGLLAEH
jgi:cytochrome c biogenesis protein CcmG/thiol:disulfide interchange protein DsbE